MRQSDSLHERGEAGPVSSVGIGSEHQQEVEELDVHRRDEVDLGAEEVPLVGVGAVLEQHPGYLEVSVADGESERLVAQQCPGERVVVVFTVVHPGSHPQQQSYQFYIPETFNCYSLVVSLNPPNYLINNIKRLEYIDFKNSTGEDTQIPRLARLDVQVTILQEYVPARLFSER